MGIFEILNLICGLALFLYGMEVMGDSLKKSAGNRLKTILGKMTSNQFKGFLLGLGVTAVIQSSSATTVMVVGFVNSGTMTLTQAIGVIMGANVGTAVTSWLTALSGIGGEGAELVGYIEWLKPSAWMPILALIGICLIMFSKRGKKKDIGAILLGFSVLMVGMDIMSASVSGLKNDEAFKNLLTMFDNPILGVMAGLVLTAIVQSSSASVGILQSLTATGAITYGAAIPIIMGQNIGTCVTALISSFGANKNGKRAALAHLYFNVINVIIVLSTFYIIDGFVDFAFLDQTIGMWGVAGVHTLFKLISVAIMFPFTKWLEKLAVISVKDKNEDEQVNLLDERLIETPSVAIACADQVARSMADISCKALRLSLELLSSYDDKKADLVREYESKADVYEDALGTYLVKLSGRDMTVQDSHEVTKLLHIIGDFERISDHAVNILESAEEMKDKKITFSKEAQKEISVMVAAINEIITLADKAYDDNDLATAALVEPLEQVVDNLKYKIKLNHILRLQKNECTIEHGFILSDLLTNFERVSDHCSNIAGCLIELSKHNSLDMHKYLGEIKDGSREFDNKFKEYKAKYAL
jgi:phosphate:Na+ symporter